MRDELIEDGTEPLPFVGCCGRDSAPAEAAAAMRESLALESDWAARKRRWTDALRHLRDRAEAHGILVVFNGIVGNNTHRRLDRKEFQGFALIDRYAPLVFVNGADFKAAQMFTLAHELAHVFVGAAGVSNLDVAQSPGHDTERFCNSAAAEFLVSEEELVAHWRRAETVADSLQAVRQALQGQCVGRCSPSVGPGLDRGGRVPAVLRHVPSSGRLVDLTRRPAATSGTARTFASAVDSA